MEINRRSYLIPAIQDLNMLGTSLPQSRPPADPAPLGSGDQGGWGSALRDLSQEGLKSGINELKKKGTYKDSDSARDGSTTSLGNIGGEKLPDNLSSLGAWGKGKTLAEFEWHAARIGDVDYQDSGDWGSFYVKGATDFLKVQGRVYGDVGFKDWTVTAGGGGPCFCSA